MSTPAGPVDAWLLEAGLETGDRVQYLVAKKFSEEPGHYVKFSFQSVTIWRKGLTLKAFKSPSKLLCSLLIGDL